MRPPRGAPRWLITAGAVAAAILLVAVVDWLRVDAFAIGRSDFTSTYMGATLLRTDRGAMYDESTQHALHDRLIAPDREGNLPFVDLPVAAALAVPVSLLSLDTAYRVWSLVQAAVLVASVVIAARAAPWPAMRARTRQTLTVVAAAGAGTLDVLLQAQWDAVNALAVAVAYACWRRGRFATGGAVLAAGAMVAKPHVMLGFAAMILGWRERRVIAGAALATLAMAVVSVAVAGPHATGDLVHMLAGSTTRWPLTEQIGTVGLVAHVAGDTAAAHAAGLVLAAVALLVAGWLGVLLRRDRARLERTLAGAAVVSVLASPHAYPQDLAVLAPAAVAVFAAAAASPSPALRDAAMAWSLANLVMLAVLGNGGAMVLMPLVLVALLAGVVRCDLRPAPAS